MTHEHNKLVRFAQLLTRSQERITIESDKAYQQITVRLWGKGVVERGVIQGSQIAAPSQFVARPGQFIISRIDARNGAFGLVPATLDGAVVTNDFPIFFVNTEKILPEFLAWMSKTQRFVDLCIAASEGTTNRVRLQEERFLATEITLPPLDEQRRIVARIEALAGRVAEAQRLRAEAMAAVEALTTSVMQNIFTSVPNTQEVKLEDVCELIIDCLHSTPRYADDGTPTVRSPDVGWGTLDLENALRTDEVEYIHRTQRGVPQVDDIIFVREGGGVGKAAIVREGQKFSLGQRTMMMRPNKNVVLPRFFLYQLLSPVIYQDQILTRLKGSASPHLNIATLRKFSFLLPDLTEQMRIVNELDNLRYKLDSLRQLQAATQAELDALLPTILDKAFRGEL